MAILLLARRRRRLPRASSLRSCLLGGRPSTRSGAALRRGRGCWGPRAHSGLMSADCSCRCDVFVIRRRNGSGSSILLFDRTNRYAAPGSTSHFRSRRGGRLRCERIEGVILVRLSCLDYFASRATARGTRLWYGGGRVLGDRSLRDACAPGGRSRAGWGLARRFGLGAGCTGAAATTPAGPLRAASRTSPHCGRCWW